MYYEGIGCFVHLDPKNIPSKHRTSGGMAGCLGICWNYPPETQDADSSSPPG